MKKIIYFLCSLLMMSCHTKKNIEDSKNDEPMVDEHNSMNALDWQGTYTGILPCADCEGIETVLILTQNLQYSLRETYKGKDLSTFKEEGTFSWEKNGQIIRLDQHDERRYFVGENTLHKLDLAGNKITGDLAQAYVLSKEFTKITDSHWALIALHGQDIDYDKKKGNQPYLILRTSAENEHTVFGNGGCNRFSGKFELKEGQRLQFSTMATTKMSCLNIELEQRFLAALGNIDNYSLQGDTLTLQKAKMAPIAKFVKLYFQ